MDLHYLEIFNTVAKHSSFKKASEILHISQPALSIQVKKLENQIDLKLFYKIGNKMYLSESGLMLYNYTQKIFSLVDEMENNIMSQNEFVGGTINLGGSNTPGTYILPTVIGEMKKLYPSVTINLHIANTSEITTLIDNGTLDIAVNGGNGNYSNHIFMEKLFDDKLVIVASPKNKLCEKEGIDIEDLSDESFVVHEKTSQLYTCFKIFTEEYNIPENICMYLGSIDSIKHAVIASLGISIMPYYAVKFEIEMGLLKELNIGRGVFHYPYNLIYNTNKNISLTTQKFIEILKKVCRN
ncbi:MAG: transcriptional regulator, LysR family [Herbinix sp.]|jgi:DNA-binding transcriptional LysR family regulator|nr:transcriptional regulator, LysR family [Herbinix sp.]